MASCPGVSHAHDGTPCQDAFSCQLIASRRPTLVAILSDGAGSAIMGREGAILVARTVSVLARAHLVSNFIMPTHETLCAWVAVAQERIAQVATSRRLLPRDFAATMLCVVSDGTESVAAHIGDGAAAVQLAEDGSWQTLSWPSHGEYASTTYFVSDMPTPNVIVTRLAQPIKAIIAFTDGLERLALDFSAQVPHPPFFQGIVEPVATSTVQGRDANLCGALRRFLDSSAVNARTDDDKTLLIATRR